MSGGEGTMTTDSDRRREARLRGRARQLGLKVRRARSREGIENRGGFMLVIGDREAIVAGERFDLTLDELEADLAEFKSRGMNRWFVEPRREWR
jgi:hypothetical protein